MIQSIHGGRSDDRGPLLVYLGVVRPDGFVGAVAFFAHEGHALAPYRLPLTAALDRLGAATGALRVTFVPTRGHALEVAATVALVHSTVARHQLHVDHETVSKPAGGVRMRGEEEVMSRITIFEILTLDGVYQAPAAADEDPRDGFAHGGWALPYSDEEAGRAAAESMDSTGAILLGRRTYQHFATVWPGRTDNPFSQVLDNTQKYVVSRTLTEPLEWRNSTLLSTMEGVADLKGKLDRDIVVLGSGELVRSLLQRRLVDELILLIHPILLGSGRRLFPDGAARADLTLTGTRATGTGVVVATYRADA